MYKKRFYSLVVIIFILSMAVGTIKTMEVSAKTGPVNATSRIEGVLVVDVSKSMLSSDPNNISSEAMKMFVDMSSIKGDKIGVIAYGNDIVAKKDMTKLQSEADKQAIKTFIDSLTKAPYTDMSTGLAEAVKSLNASHEAAYSPLIVLLADGNNDLDKSKPKTLQQADEQIAQTVAAAKEKGYPIYVIGLNADGKLNKEALQKIATGSNGKFFETNNAGDLPGILSEIFANHLKLKLVPIKDVIAKQEFQDVLIKIPNENVLEANISLISSKPVELKLVDPSGKEQAIPSNTIILTKSKNYSMLKLINPVQGDWVLKVKGTPQDKINIKLVFNNDLQLKLAPLAKKKYAAGNKVKISAFFEDNGKQIENKELYKALKGTLFVKDLDKGKTQEIPLNADAKGFTGDFKIGGSTSYEVTVKAEGNSFFRETKPQRVTVAAAAPPEPEPVVKPDKNLLNKLELFPWLYIVIGVVGLMIITTPVFSYASKKRKENRGFSGQIVVEIEDEISGHNSAQQVKKLKHFKGEFVLNQLFMLDPEFMETDQITFVPLTDNTLLLLNKSECTIDMGGEVIDAETGHRLRRDDKLRIRLKNMNKSIYIENAS